MIETWKDVKGFNGDYLISNLGNVKSLKGKERTLSARYCGLYLAVCLYDSNIKRNNKYIHRLVAEAFIPNDGSKSQKDHKDGNRNNNTVDNLEWCTGSENIKHAYKLGLRLPPCASTGKFAYDHHRSKEIIQCNLKGEYINKYGSVREAERQTQINKVTIAKCARKEVKTAGGFIWNYNDESNVLI